MQNFKNVPEFVYIYGLIDPRNNKIRYIGWCINPSGRLKSHLMSSQLKRNTHKINWIKQLLSINLKPILEILEIVSITDYAIKEQWWIKIFGRENLTNSTDGGEGTLNPSDETREKISKSQIGRKMSQETRDRMSKSQKGKHVAGTKKSEESKKKQSESRKGDKNPNFGKKMSEEQKIKISKARINKYVGEASPNFGKPKSLETRKKLSYENTGKMQKYGYIGISYLKESGHWQTRISYCGETIILGTFPSKIEAALAYNEAALEFWGWKAKLNIISQEEIDKLWEME
jgi:group I intron endonuclease